MNFTLKKINSKISKNQLIIIEESRGTIIENSIYELKGNGINICDSDVLIKENIIENSEF